ncbi:MAG: hypothetical protein LBJ46_02630 [Planctomycetota bacterium]|jgi:hypothetical protein|nr:hypothetical protein [Planctomycetota bacterium]
MLFIVTKEPECITPVEQATRLDEELAALGAGHLLVLNATGTHDLREFDGEAGMRFPLDHAAPWGGRSMWTSTSAYASDVPNSLPKPPLLDWRVSVVVT